MTCLYTPVQQAELGGDSGPAIWSGAPLGIPQGLRVFAAEACQVCSAEQLSPSTGRTEGPTLATGASRVLESSLTINKDVVFFPTSLVCPFFN